MPVRWLALVVAVGAAAAAGCGGGEDEDGRDGEDGSATAPNAPAGGGPAARTGERPRVETVATGLEAPWEIAFLADGRALITERPGRVRLLSAAGELRERPVATVDVAAEGEGGLLGLAVDPDFEDEPLVYLYLTHGDTAEIARYRLAGGALEREATVVEGIRSGPVHDGGRIHFGPGGRLHAATGDAADPGLAQDERSLNGKLLRLGRGEHRGDGARPEIFTLGHRNPQGFDWEPGSGRLIATEHGAQALDEVNHLERGRNYGWPEVEGEDHGPFAAPLIVYEQTVAPSGATFVARAGSAWTGDYLFGGLVGEQIRRIRLDGDRVTVDEPLFEGRFGRVRTVVEGPDGALYALTANRDGRGSPGADDDRVLRIVPPAAEGGGR